MTLNKHLISGLAASAIVASVGLAYAQTGGTSASGTTGQGPVSQETQPAGSSNPATQPSTSGTMNQNSTTSSPSSTDTSTTTPSGTVNMTDPAPQADRN